MNQEQQVRVLESQLKLANAELAKLRRRLNESGAHGKRIEQAYRDALLLAQLHVAYQPTTRHHATTFTNMTDHRWENARALLALARVHNGRHWVAHDLGTIEAALGKAATRAIDAPEAYRARLPRHARPGSA